MIGQVTQSANWFSELASERLLFTLAIGVLVALIGNVFAGFVRAINYKIVGQIKYTADLYQEFNNESMSRHRRRAYDLVKKYGNYSIDEIDKAIQEQEKISPEEASERLISLYIVLRYYQRVSALARDGALRSIMALNLFGPNFEIWYSIYFEEKISDWHEASNDINNFHEWLYAEAHRRWPMWKIWRPRNIFRRKRDSLYRLKQIEIWRKNAMKEKVKVMSTWQTTKP